MITLCTLFNSNYLDKGLTMYESIDRYTHDFVLFVLCMDDRCYEVMEDLSLSRFIPVKMSDFETPELLKVKGERSMGEYCWTCGSCFTDYVMNTFSPEYCAYIDSDLYFYDDVNVVVKEMQERNASVMITGHRFNWYDRKEMEWRVGKYCVEFNTFKNDENGRSLLATWKRQCLEYCKIDGDGVHWADQKYLDNWCDDYEFCVETKNLGAGIAPWNIAQYILEPKDIKTQFFIKCRGKVYRPFFYHFQNFTFLSETIADSHTSSYWGVDFGLVRAFYENYFRHLLDNKEILKKRYNIFAVLKKHPGIAIRENESIFRRFVQLFERHRFFQYIIDVIFHKLPYNIYKEYGIIRFVK